MRNIQRQPNPTMMTEPAPKKRKITENNYFKVFSNTKNTAKRKLDEKAKAEMHKRRRVADHELSMRKMGGRVTQKCRGRSSVKALV